MKQILQYIGYIMAVFGFASAIWTVAVKTYERRHETLDVKEELTEIKNIIVTKEDIKNVVLLQMEQSLTPVVESQNALRRSYVSLVKKLYTDKEKALTFEEFAQYMQGIEYELNVPKLDTTSIKISIKKVDGKKKN